MTGHPAPRSVPLSEAVLRAVVMGLPETVAVALERQAEPGLDPVTVAAELASWRHVCELPRADLAALHNDWTELAGPMARTVLEAALEALGHPGSAPLRREVARLDDLFESKTLHNPRTDPALPWWQRRWWH